MTRQRNGGDDSMLLFLLAGGAAAWWYFSQQNATPATAPATSTGGTVPSSSGNPSPNPSTLNVGPAGTTPQIPVTTTPPASGAPGTIVDTGQQIPVPGNPILPAPPQPVVTQAPPTPAPVVIATPPPAPAPAPVYAPPPAPVPVAVAPTPVPAQITSPPNGAQLQTDTVVLQWSPGVGVDGYTIGIGDQPDYWDFAQQSGGPGFLTLTVHGLPTDGRTLYANVFSSIGANPFVRGNQITLKAANGAAPPASSLPPISVNPPVANPPAATPPPAPASSGKLAQMYNWLQGATSDIGSHFTAAQWTNFLASSTGESVNASPLTIFGYDPGSQQMTIDQFWGPMSAYLRSYAGFSGLGRLYPVRSPWAA